MFCFALKMTRFLLPYFFIQFRNLSNNQNSLQYLEPFSIRRLHCTKRLVYSKMNIRAPQFVRMIAREVCDEKNKERNTPKRLLTEKFPFLLNRKQRRENSKYCHWKHLFSRVVVFVEGSASWRDYFSSHHSFSFRTCSSSEGVKSFLMLKVLRISSGVLPLIMLATVLQVTSRRPWKWEENNKLNCLKSRSVFDYFCVKRCSVHSKSL